MSSEHKSPDMLRVFIYNNYTETVKFAVDLDDSLINNQNQAVNEFRKFYRNFLILYIVTNNFLNGNVDKDTELKKLMDDIEIWIAKIKEGRYNNPKIFVDNTNGKSRTEKSIRTMNTAYMLMQEGIILFNDYTHHLIKNRIIRLE